MHCTKTQSWKSRSFYSLVYPKYKLIKDLVHYILSGCNVHDGLCGNNEFFEQVLMFLRDISHREASLHGMELVPGLDLHHGQRHRCAMTNAVKSDLLDVGQNIMEAGVDEGAPSVDSIHSRVRRQLKGLQLHR